uniref:Uncharacterized protein n=1 Tax=Physcomitrium patens TaxID=3218 RepID=A0A2K1IIR5_PHYPA|nr:hypothetical protein PHYPA_027858 [Physcomitrium patens]
MKTNAIHAHRKESVESGQERLAYNDHAEDAHSLKGNNLQPQQPPNTTFALIRRNFKEHEITKYASLPLPGNVEIDVLSFLVLHGGVGSSESDRDDTRSVRVATTATLTVEMTKCLEEF